MVAQEIVLSMGFAESIIMSAAPIGRPIKLDTIIGKPIDAAIMAIKYFFAKLTAPSLLIHNPYPAYMLTAETQTAKTISRVTRSRIPGMAPK